MNSKKTPDRWTRKQVVRRRGATKGKTDIYYYSPNGKLFRSKCKLLTYIETNNLNLDINDFDFVTVRPKLKPKTESLQQPVKALENTREIQPITNQPVSLNSGSKDEIYLCCENERINSKEVLFVNEESVFERDESYDMLEISQSVINLSESCEQLKFEKDKSEKKISNLQREAEEIILKCEEEIQNLKKENLVLKQSIETKEKEIIHLKNCIGIERVCTQEKTHNKMEMCVGCANYKFQIRTLSCKIENLSKENVQLMESITPYPLPQADLKLELQEKNNIIKDLIKNFQDNQTNFNEIERVLQADFEQLYLENQKLINENLELKIACEDAKGNEEKIILSNRLNILSQSEDSFNLNQTCKESSCINVNTKNNISEFLKEKLKMRSLENIIKKSPDMEKGNRKDKILILADSHGRNIAPNLAQIWHNRTSEIMSIFKPNATLTEVIKDLKTVTKSFNKKDRVIIIGGSNDNLVNGKSQLIDTFKRVIKWTAHTNIIVAGLPCKYHTPKWNNRVSYVNMELEELINNTEHASFLPLGDLCRKMHTKHGLHLNKAGKKMVANMIKEIIHFKPQEVIEDCMLLEEGNIKVIETDMRRMIERYKQDPNVAFAHSISADIDKERNMSAGVAVAFRTSFGRPKSSDFVNSRLSYQETEDGASVYSLMTKPEYFHKPRKEVYNEAFLQLAEHFKLKKLKTLICSPMGCIRDLIEPCQLINNLARFHHITGAKVMIVIFNQISTGVLRNGLSQLGFVRKLRGEIKRLEIHQSVAQPTSEVQIAPVQSVTTYSLSPIVSPVPEITDKIIFPPLPSPAHLRPPKEGSTDLSLPPQADLHVSAPSAVAAHQILSMGELPLDFSNDAQHLTPGNPTHRKCISGGCFGGGEGHDVQVSGETSGFCCQEGEPLVSSLNSSLVNLRIPT